MRAGAMAAALLVASGIGLATTAAAETDPSVGVLERLARGGEPLRIGFRVNTPPFSRGLSDAERQELENKRGRRFGLAAGFSIDLCDRIVAAVRQRIEPKTGATLKVLYVPVGAGDRFRRLEDGKIDLLCGATTFTLHRQKRFDFSLFTFVTSGSLLHRRGKTPRGFYGDKVGVIVNSSSLVALRQQTEAFEPAPAIVTVTDHNVGLQKLRDGEIDSYFGDRVILRRLMQRADGEFRLARLRLSNEPYALPIRKGDPDFLFLINQTLTALYTSGEIYEIYGKWFPSSRVDASATFLYSLMAAPTGVDPAKKEPDQR